MKLVHLQELEGALLLSLKKTLSASDQDTIAKREQLLEKLHEVQSVMESRGIKGLPLPKEISSPPPSNYDSDEQARQLLIQANERLKQDLGQQRHQVSQLLGEIELIRRDRDQKSIHNSRLLTENSLLNAQLESLTAKQGDREQVVTKTKSSTSEEKTGSADQLKQETLRLQQRIESLELTLQRLKAEHSKKIKALDLEIARKRLEFEEASAAVASVTHLYEQAKAKLGPTLDALKRLGLKINFQEEDADYEDVQAEAAED